MDADQRSETRTASPNCERSACLFMGGTNLSNRRMRTRMYGGVAGAERRLSPLCRFLPASCFPIRSSHRRIRMNTQSMRTLHTLDYPEARRALDLIVEKASQLQKSVVVAIADSHGDLICLARMDGAPVTSIRVAG